MADITTSIGRQRGVAARKAVPKRGRPRQFPEAERRQMVLDAAEQVFVELGYTDASMDDIAHRAAMSKKTLYQLFDTKETLFAAVIASRRAELAATVGGDDLTDARSIEETLRHYLTKLARFVLAPRQAALYRLVIAESHRAPELARAFHQEGPSKGCHVLQDWLLRQNESGRLAITDPCSAATMLFSMVVAEPQTCTLVGDGPSASEAQIAERVRQAVKLFLEGALPRNGSARIRR